MAFCGEEDGGGERLPADAVGEVGKVGEDREAALKFHQLNLEH